MAPTRIEWTDETWNPVTGCTKVSPGCDHCYAETMTRRFPDRGPFEQVQLHHDRVCQPMSWRKPRMIFTCSMGDLFHSDVPWTFIIAVFCTMAQTPWHTYQILTKRPGRMAHFAEHIWGETGYPWPPNVWAGTSVEQEWDGNRRLTARLDLLAKVPARVRFVSYEPALGAVDFTRYLVNPHDDDWIDGQGYGAILQWLIAGGESGPGDRPAHPDWFRTARDQCQAAGVPFFFKQWGEWHPIVTQQAVGDWKPVGADAALRRIHLWDDGEVSIKIGKKAAGALLDGREWREFPQEGKV